MQKIVIAVSGASGAIYAKGVLDKLLEIKNQWQELALVMTDNARYVWQYELGNEAYKNYPVRLFDKNDFTAPFASGSGRFGTMIIVPCSMGTLGRIANGISDDLITRAADVVLKERRKLILAIRDTPYNLLHLRNMEQVTLAGGVICPCTPSFYSRPATVEEVAATVTDRIIDLAGLQIDTYRWNENEAE